MALLALTAARILTPLEMIAEGMVIVEGDAIRSVSFREQAEVPSGARLVELGDKTLAPGFVDVHIHGGAGHDVMEGTPEALAAVAALALEHGTTCFVPTTLTAAPPVLLKSLEGISNALRNWSSRASGTKTPLAEPAGIHLEGPFLSPQRRGAHPREHLEPPSLSLLGKLLEAAGGWARILTLAPELPGAGDVQQQAQRSGVRVALGHSDATHAQAAQAVAAGAALAVHVFNAMRPFAHRESGILGAVLTDDRVVTEVIADGVHVSAPALQLLLRAKGVNRIALVTDGISATGCGPGRYRLGEMEIEVEENPDSGRLACRNTEGTLAGSVLTLDQAVHNMMEFTGVAFQDAVTMATLNPARLLGLEQRKGSLHPGADADLVVLNADGTVAGVMARGRANFL